MDLLLRPESLRIFTIFFFLVYYYYYRSIVDIQYTVLPNSLCLCSFKCIKYISYKLCLPLLKDKPCVRSVLWGPVAQCPLYTRAICPRGIPCVGWVCPPVVVGPWLLVGMLVGRAGPQTSCLSGPAATAMDALMHKTDPRPIHLQGLVATAVGVLVDKPGPQSDCLLGLLETAASVLRDGADPQPAWLRGLALTAGGLLTCRAVLQCSWPWNPATTLVGTLICSAGLPEREVIWRGIGAGQGCPLVGLGREPLWRIDGAGLGSLPDREGYELLLKGASAD